MTFGEALRKSEPKWHRGSVRYPHGDLDVDKRVLDRLGVMAKKMGISKKHLGHAFLLMCLDKFEHADLPFYEYMYRRGNQLVDGRKNTRESYDRNMYYANLGRRKGLNRTCVLCDTNISNKVAQAKYCDKCRKSVRKEKQRREYVNNREKILARNRKKYWEKKKG